MSRMPSYMVILKTVYMHQSLGFRNPKFPHHVCRLNKSIYRLKEAPRVWYHRFVNFVTHSTCDHSLFIYKKGSTIAYLVQYVADIILIVSSSSLL